MTSSEKLIEDRKMVGGFLLGELSSNRMSRKLNKKEYYSYIKYNSFIH